jgi:branched-chain amino acid transport system substrate-binding protein
MRSITRRLSVIAVASLTTAVLGACSGSSSLSDQEQTADSGPVKIGLLVPKSGVYAPLGADMENGFRLYLDAKGGKLGGRDVELVAADEGEGPDTGVPAAQKLVQQDRVNVVAGIVNSATALGVRDLFTDSKVPLIVANAGANDITGTGRSDYVWRTSFTNGEVAAALGPYVAQQVNGGKVYLIAPDYAAGKEAIGGFRQAFEGAGGSVAGSESTPFGTTTNFQPYLSRIQQSGAKAVYCFYAGAEAVAFVKQYKEFGLSGKVPLYCSGFTTEGGVLTAQGSAALGIKTSLHYSDQIDNPTNKRFVADYTAKYDAPPTVYATQAYDAAAVLDQALAKGTTGDGILEGLRGITQIDSPRGIWRFSDGHGPVQTYYLRDTRQQGDRVVNAVVQPLTQP